MNTYYQFNLIFQECEEHLSLGSEAESHYKAVCRALVSESLELTSFMEKIKSNDAIDTSQELKELAVQDWVRKAYILSINI
jgi:hypothetical protein